MGNGWKLSADKEWNIVTRLSKGEPYKTIAWDEGVSYTTVTNTRNRLPLFSWHKDDSDDDS